MSAQNTAAQDFSQLHAQVLRSLERLGRLESGATDTELLVGQSSLSQIETTKSINEEFARIQSSLASLHEDIAVFTKLSGKVMLRFKELVKKDQLAEIEDHLDKKRFEEYISRDEFYALLNAHLKELL